MCFWRCWCGDVWDEDSQTCTPKCNENEFYSYKTDECQLNCQNDEVYVDLYEECQVKTICEADENYDRKMNKCSPICKEGYDYIDGKCVIDMDCPPGQEPTTKGTCVDICKVEQNQYRRNFP